MDSHGIGERLRIELEILSHVREALKIAMSATIDSQTSAQWLDRFNFLMDSFGRHLQRTFSIEEEGGYMDAVQQTPFSDLDRKADCLLNEHRLIREELASISDEARSSSPHNLANLHYLRRHLTGLLARIEEHQRLEHDLWTETFHVEIGGEGG